ncbi:MAG: DNA recombination protein RmuC [Gemmobacter sp.]
MIAEAQARLTAEWLALRAAYPGLTEPPVLWAAAAALVLALCLALALRSRARRGRALDAAAAAQAETAASHAAALDARDAARAAETAAHDRTRAERDTALSRAATAETALGEARETLAAREATLAAREAALAAATTRHERDDTRIAEAQRLLQQAAARIAALQAELEAARRDGAEKVALLSAVRSDMEKTFRVLADETMRTQSEALAKSSTERLTAILDPLKDHVGRFEQELRNVHLGAAKEREALKTEIAELTRRSAEVSREAVALTRALKGDKQRQGAWGEMILASILERSGLEEGAEYETQTQRTDDEGGRYRPDVVVRMPGGKALVIDSKVSLIDYEAAVNAEDEGTAAAARRRHVAALRSHITGLSDKGYQTKLGEATVDYVVMFIPIEGALSEALREDGALTQFALDRNITIATPTTLMMALRTVAHVWGIERRNRNAEDIAARAGKLYDKVAGFVDALNGVGKGLAQAQKNYDDAVQRLTRGSGNVLAQVDMLKTLGARAQKTLPADFDPADSDAGEAEPRQDRIAP